MNDVAIIGDTGFIGSHLKKKLRNNFNYNSKDINLFDSKISENFNPKIRKVVFLAGDPRMYFYENRPEECFRNNHQLIKNIIKMDVEHFIFMSSVCVYSYPSKFSVDKSLGWNNTSKFYGISKLLAEYEIRQFVKNFTIIRLSTPFGNNMKKGPLFDIIKKNQSFVHQDSEYSFIHIDDVTNAIKHIIQNKILGYYNLTANESFSIKSIITNKRVEFLSDKKIFFDSDNKELVDTGWQPKISVHEWYEGVVDIK